jgi:Uma2 family endonuclease
MEDLPHYTYDDYVQWEGRWEIINGIPYAMTPAPVLKHQRLSLKIASQLDALLENCTKCSVYQAIDWQLTEDTVIQPDVLVTCGENPNEKKLEITPILIFEILSPSTSRKDRVLKYQLYEKMGVKYFCIVAPETNSAEVFVLKKEKYRETEEFNKGRMFFDLGPCQIQFYFGKVFT